MAREDKNEALHNYSVMLANDVLSRKVTPSDADAMFCDFRALVECTCEAPDTVRDMCPPTLPTGVVPT